MAPFIRAGFPRFVAILLAVAASFAPSASSALEMAGKGARESKVESVGQKRQEPPAPLQEAGREKFEQPEGAIALVRESLDELGKDVRANAKSIEGLKSKLEEIAIRSYERLAAEEEVSENLEALSARVAAIEAGMAGQADRQKRVAGAIHPGSQAMASPSAAENAAASAGTSGGAGVAHDGASTRLLVATLLVFAVPLGLTLLEASQLEQWAVPHIGLRNLSVSAVLVVTYFTVGYGVMFGETFLGALDGTAGASTSAAAANQDLAIAFRLYQLGLAVVAGMVVTTILSDRLSLPAYVFLALVMGAWAYPVLGQWSASGPWSAEKTGWLEKLGFADFAGATSIHSLAAWIALAVARMFPVLRFLEPGEGPRGISHQPDASRALVGLLVVWVGWFGLIIGHQDFAAQRSAFLVANALLAGAAALLVSLACRVVVRRKSGVGATYAGIAAGTVGGLVAISAAADAVTPLEAIVIGGGAGLLQPVAYRILSTWVIEQDQAAANMIAVHGGCGVWGTLCVGLFGTAGLFGKPDLAQTGIQAVGILTVFFLGAMTGLLGAGGYRVLSRLTSRRDPF